MRFLCNQTDRKLLLLLRDIRCFSLPFHIIAQPCLGKLPVPLHGLFGQVERSRHFRVVQAGEVTQLDYFRLLGISRGKSFQGSVPGPSRRNQAS